MSHESKVSPIAVVGALAFALFVGTLSWQWQTRTTVATWRNDSGGKQVMSLDLNRRPHGRCFDYRKDGTLLSETDYEHGQWVHRVLYYPEGQVWQEHFTDGRGSRYYDRDGNEIPESIGLTQQ